MQISVDIQGLQGVEEALTQAGPKLAKAALRKALRAGGAVFVEAVKARAPVRSGVLRESITMSVKLTPKEQAGTVKVGPRRGEKGKGSKQPAVYGMFQEFGTKDMSAQPFLRPAFDSAMKRAQEAFAEQIAASVEVLKQK